MTRWTQNLLRSSEDLAEQRAVLDSIQIEP
jgi:hypothetical protein